MLTNALFLLKNLKNRRALGAPPPNPRNISPNEEFLATRLTWWLSRIKHDMKHSAVV